MRGSGGPTWARRRAPSPFLPFVDRIEEDAADPRAAMERLVRRLTGMRPPSAFVALWGLEPRAGFRLAERAPDRVVLTGRHRFSTYTLTFEATDGRVAAITHAAFPGVAGRLYRAAVIGSGAHAVLVRRMLRAAAT